MIARFKARLSDVRRTSAERNGRARAMAVTDVGSPDVAAATAEAKGSPRPAERKEAVGRSLSTKLVGFVALFVMVAEVLMFVPSIATFRQTWLNNRLAAAQLASLAADVAPESAVPEPVKAELLRTAQIRMVALKRNDQRRLILQEEMDEPVSATYDLRPAQLAGAWQNPTIGLGLVRDALAVYVTDDRTLMRVIGQPNENAGESIEIVMPVGPLKAAMVRYGLNILALSIMISLLAAIPIYLILNWVFIRPITDLSRAMERFSENPEDARRIIVPSKRTDEIGIAERELASMQSELAQTLGHKSRLAALGLAVSKINHDLRNLLANAQLLSDRLASVPEPTVQRLAPKLVASIDRAIRFCNDTLQYGRAAEPQPRREAFDLRALVVDVGEGLDMAARTHAGWVVDVPQGLVVDADRDQMYRVLNNLVRNALQAIEAQYRTGEGARAGGEGETRCLVTVTGRRHADKVVIDVRDTGPGLPPAAREKLFRPFEGSTRKDGSGLGLSIVQEIVMAHGGRIDLVTYASGVRGAHFRIELPDDHLA